MRLFFATDLHGSEVCFRKFVAAAAFYSCEALILGGDVSGKFLVPISLESEYAEYELGGQQQRVPRDAVETAIRRIADMGYYAILADADEREELAEPQVYEDRLLKEAINRVRSWVGHAEERLGDAGVRILVAPGNDDDPAIDEAFEGSRVFINGERDVVRFDGIEVASCGWSNPTPWNTPRECSEEELEQRLREVIALITNPASAIFNFHVPPHGTPLDVCAQLDSELRVVTVMGNPVPMHAGSSAVRSLIEEYQPLAGLHGHIHESRHATRLGRTIVINPGSEYAEGVLLGAIATIEKGRVHYAFTAG